MYRRTLFANRPPEASCFVFGARQTGKTTLLQTLDTALHYDLLRNQEFVRLNRDPDIVFNECAKVQTKTKSFVWIDEVQKIPRLLDVVHRAIEAFPHIDFILSGSSARKLRQDGVNLLGGRALSHRLHPLTMEELGDQFELETAVQIGTLPKIYSLHHEGKGQLARRHLRSYLALYLEEEIKKEALVRDLQPFQRFLEVAAQVAGQLVNVAKIADESQISHTAATNYFSILEDTLIGFFVPAYHASVRKQLVKQPKFYLFDNGVHRAIQGCFGTALSGLEKGVLYEQFIVQEIRRVSDYAEKDFKFYFWRTEAGAEVDLLICRGTQILLAVECKASSSIRKRDLSGLRAFKKANPKVPTIVCAPVERAIQIDTGFDALPLDETIKMVKTL